MSSRPSPRSRPEFEEIGVDPATGRPDAGELAITVSLLRHRSGAEVTVLDGKLDTIYAPADQDLDVPDYYAQARRALRTGSGVHTLIGDELVAVEPIRIGKGGTVDAVVLVRRLEYVISTVKVVKKAFLEAAAVGLGIALLLGIALTTTLLRRLERLREAAGELERHGLDAPIHLDDRHDEIGDLTRAFASMQARLRRQDTGAPRVRGDRLARAAHAARLARRHARAARRRPRPASDSTWTTRASARCARASSRAGSRASPPTCSTSAASTRRYRCAPSRSSSASCAGRWPPNSSVAPPSDEVHLEVRQPPRARAGRCAIRARSRGSCGSCSTTRSVSRRRARACTRKPRQRASWAQVSVSDAGPGVPARRARAHLRALPARQHLGRAQRLRPRPGDRARACDSHGRLLDASQTGRCRRPTAQATRDAQPSRPEPALPCACRRSQVDEHNVA